MTILPTTKRHWKGIASKTLLCSLEVLLVCKVSGHISASRPLLCTARIWLLLWLHWAEGSTTWLKYQLFLYSASWQIHSKHCFDRALPLFVYTLRCKGVPQATVCCRKCQETLFQHRKGHHSQSLGCLLLSRDHTGIGVRLCWSWDLDSTERSTIAQIALYFSLLFFRGSHWATFVRGVCERLIIIVSSLAE